MGLAARAVVLIAVLAGAGTARAERRPGPFPDVVAWALRTTDAGRWEVGTGVSGGWRSLLELHGRYYVSDSVTGGVRLRLDLDDAAPRALEFAVGKAIGTGKMRFVGDAMVKSRLVFEWGTAAVRFRDVFVGFGFAGLSLRLQPHRADWFMLELGVRQSYAPRVVEVAARAIAEPQLELRYDRATELRAAVSVLWPRPRRECVGVGRRR